MTGMQAAIADHMPANKRGYSLAHLTIFLALCDGLSSCPLVSEGGVVDSAADRGTPLRLCPQY